MIKGIVAGSILYSSLLLANVAASKSLQQKVQLQESKTQSDLVQQKSIKIKDGRNKNKSYPRGTIATH